VKILFWLLVAGDALALLLLFLLGLAAAPSSRTSPLAVAWSMLLVPVAVLALAIFLFHRVNTPLARGAGMVLVALPLLIVLGMRSYSAVRIAAATEENGTFRYFRAGPARAILDAIDRNDAAAVTRLAPQVDLNARGLANMTLLMYAIRRLEEKPHELDPLRALLAAGADPNRVADELPLMVAIQLSREAGTEPVAMLLAAGANPNTPDQFGSPVYFMAVGITVPVEVLRLLLDHGADLTVRDRGGRSVAFAAATTSNWHAVLLLLQRGVTYEGRSINGESFVEMVASHIRVFGDTAGAAEVLAYLKRQAPGETP
jgi:hypothetical protein